MATVFDVAAYLLSKADAEEGDGMTHLKLQKLVYYAQGFALVLLGAPLFQEKIEAWPHGPVCKELYGAYRDYRNNIITDPMGGDIDALSEEQKSLIDDVFDVYGQYSASKLRNLSHSEAPWRDVENKVDTTITHEAMREFFPSLLVQ